MPSCSIRRRDEVEVRLAVLHAIVALGVWALEGEPVVAEAQVLENLFDDLRGGLFWKIRQSAVRVSNHSQGTTSARYIRMPAPAELAGGETADHTVEWPLVLASDSPGDGLADDVPGGQPGVLGQHLQVVAEAARQFLPPGERGEQQHVLAQRQWSRR